MPIDLRRAKPANPRFVAWLLGVITLLLVVLTLLVALSWQPLVGLDENVAQWAFDLTYDSTGWTNFWEAVATWLGPMALRAVLLVCAVVALARRELRIAVWILTVVVVEVVVAPLSKHLFDRVRPEWDTPITTISGFSYPSGHAAAAGMFATTAILLTIVLMGRSARRWVLIVVWVALGLLIGVDRIFLGVHFLSDVVGGLLLGTLIALVAWVGTMWNAVPEPTPRATVTGTGSKQLAVVLNPIKVGDPEVFRQRITTAAANSGWGEPMFLETTIEDPGAAMADDALGAGADLVIAAGGDGTIREVCHELARTGVAVGIVPLGTGNLLARNLAIPLNVDEAIDTALHGQDRAIDFVEIEGDELDETCFLVMAGLGLDAAIMTGAPDELKAKVGSLAYVWSGVRQFFRFPATRVEISVDDGPFVKHRAQTVVVGNVGFLQGRFPLLPDAEIDDGQLDVVVIAPNRLTGWVRVAWRVLTRRRRTDERLDRMTGRRVVVRADKPTPRQLDGDPIGEGTEIRAEVQQGVLLVRVPH